MSSVLVTLRYIGDPEMSTEPTPPTVAAVAIKLPSFWTRKAEIWFAQAEAQFLIRGIVDETTKYAHVVTALDDDTAGRVIDILRSPPKQPYSVLKDRLIKAFDLSEQERAARILDTNGLGDNKPSELLDRMLELVPTGQTPGFLFKEVFLRQLPYDVRSHLAQQEFPDLRDLAKAADKQFLSSGHRIQSVKPTAASVKPTTDKICWIHRKYKSQARRCIPPCSFHDSHQGNDQAGRH